MSQSFVVHLSECFSCEAFVVGLQHRNCFIPVLYGQEMFLGWACRTSDA